MSRRVVTVRAAFTLIEILVSILIFSVVSVAMVGILLTSTNIFRAGEYGRASTDEAVATLGVLDDDLKRMVPARDGGYFYALLHTFNPYTSAVPMSPGQGNGNCAVAFIISQPVPDQVQANDTAQAASNLVAGAGAHLLVIYYVESVPAPASPGGYDDVLYRAQGPILSDFSASAAITYATTTALVNTLIGPPGLNSPAPSPPYPRSGQYMGSYSISVVSRRCLHFGAWVSNDLQKRAASGSWTQDSGNPAVDIPPTATAPYDTESDPADGITAQPFPSAVRFTLVLAAGRYAPRGTLVNDSSLQANQLRLSGVNGLSTVPGAMIRIDNEWILYSGYQDGVLTVAPNGRSAQRSSTVTTHASGTAVVSGQQFSLARTFPH